MEGKAAALDLVFSELTDRTRRVIWLVAFALAAAGALALVPGVAGDPLWGNVPFTLLGVAFATAGIAMAMRLPITTRARTQAFLLASAIVAYCLGDFIWMYYELLRGVTAPYPGLADLFYGPAMYAPLGIALWSALRSLRAVRRSTQPLLIAVLVSAVAFAVLWLTVLVHVFEGPSLPTIAVSLAYPLADVFVLMFPAVALIGVLAEVGGVPLARPWYSIATAMLVLAVSDSLYSYAQTHGAYVSGSLLDLGWLVAFGMIVVGISRMLDLYTAED